MLLGSPGSGDGTVFTFVIITKSRSENISFTLEDTFLTVSAALFSYSPGKNLLTSITINDFVCF